MVFTRIIGGVAVFLGIMGCSPPVSEDSGEDIQAVIEAREGEVSIADVTYRTLQWEDSLVWLGENLRVQVEDSWCYQQREERCVEEGRLYRWEAAQKACRKLGEGWRLPTLAEWERLAKRFGGFQDYLTVEPEGDPIEANRSLLVGGTSGLGFSLAGWRGSNGGFAERGEAGFFWTATPGERDEVYIFQCQRAGKKLTRRQANPKMGFSCRCVLEL